MKWLWIYVGVVLGLLGLWLWSARAERLRDEASFVAPRFPPPVSRGVRYDPLPPSPLMPPPGTTVKAVTIYDRWDEVAALFRAAGATVSTVGRPERMRVEVPYGIARGLTSYDVETLLARARQSLGTQCVVEMFDDAGVRLK